MATPAEILADLYSIPKTTFPAAWNVKVLDKDGVVGLTWADSKSGFAGRLVVDPATYPGHASLVAEIKIKAAKNNKRSANNRRYFGAES